MITVTIDGTEVQVAEGTNLVEAAKRAGVEIPTFCYHPGLKVVGQCRICFVEVEGLPRLVTACSTIAQDAMVVLTQSERVREARAAVMEFLLANHPLDCPVCDQAGECLLQDHSVDHGLATTHMSEKKRTYPKYERRIIGPQVVQNQNRCIHCTRCVRFCQEIAESGDLAMKSRGNHSYIDTFDGQPLENPWSTCVTDVCPVGALTSKEFRFKARVWSLEETDSICPGCSIGCAIKIGHAGNQVHRFVPRENQEINGWWMCNYGRSLAEELAKHELSQPQRRQEGNLVPISWHEALGQLAQWVRESKNTRVIASANMSNEGLYLVKKVLVDEAGLEVVVPIHHGEQRRVKNARREWIESANAHPNATGAKLIGLRTVDREQLESFILASTGPVLVLDNYAHPWLTTEAAAQDVANQQILTVVRTHTPMSLKAELVLPTASWLGMEGSYTTSGGRVQLTKRGIYPVGQSKPTWEMLFLLAVKLGAEEGRSITPRAIFEELVTEVAAFAGMTYPRLASESGVPVLLEEVPHVG